MKICNKQNLLIPFIFLFLLAGCQKEDEFILNSNSNNSTNYDEFKKIYYKGFWINHRYGSTEDDLNQVHTLSYLKDLYNRLKNKNKNLSSKSTSSELEFPSYVAIYEASKVVIGNFPYEKLEGYNSPIFDENSTLDLNMIKTDFNSFNEENIATNGDIIDDYYSQNLDYEVLNEIATNPGLYDNNALNKTSSSEFFIATCTMARALTHGYGLVRSTIAYSIAGPKSKSVSSSKYPLMDPSNTRRDSFRHILWSALLAQNYFTVSSKSKRLGFSNLVTTKRETSCSDGAGNALDAREMDFHNNFIGRSIWNNNTTYRYFLGWAVGLRRPSTNKLIDLSFAKVEYQSCFIVKNHPTDSSFNFTVEQTRSEILNNIDELIAVYIKGPIVPRKYTTQTSYDYTNCNNNNNNNNNTPVDVMPVFVNDQYDIFDPSINNNDCPIISTITITIDGCFISKDPNYNPY